LFEQKSDFFDSVLTKSVSVFLDLPHFCRHLKSINSTLLFVCKYFKLLALYTARLTFIRNEKNVEKPVFIKKNLEKNICKLWLEFALHSVWHSTSFVQCHKGFCDIQN